MNLERFDAFSLKKLIAQHQHSGYLGELLGSIVFVRPTVRRKVFLVVRFADIAAQVIPSTLLIMSVAWLFLHGWVFASGTSLPEMNSSFWDSTFPGYEFWYQYLAKVGNGTLPGNPYFPDRLRGYLIVSTITGTVATLGSILLLTIVRSSRGIEGWSFEIDTAKVNENRVVSQIGPFAAVVTEESVLVKNDNTLQTFRRVPIPGKRMREVRVGELVCRLNEELLYQCDVQELIPRLENRLDSLYLKKKEVQERDRFIRVKESRLVAERREAEEYLAEKQKRMDRNQDYPWKPNFSDPLVRVLPEQYAPLSIAGLAYANVVAYGSRPPMQVYNPLQKRWDTVGPQGAQMRGIYLIGVSTQRTLNRHPLIVDPSILPGTTSNDLVMFILDRSGNVRFFANPARWEIEDCTTSDHERLKVDQLKPVLQRLYDHVLSAGPHSSGWV